MNRTLLQLYRARVALGAANFGPFTLQLNAGERVAVLGPSGAGKSTLLRLLSGELRIQHGSATLDAQDLHTWRLPALARRRAVLPQSHQVAFGLPAELVVALGRVARTHDPHQAQIVHDAMIAAQASHLFGRRFDTLSGGEQARVQLARVFAQMWDIEGGLILVDEPLAALDPGLQCALQTTMEAFAAARGHAMLAVLHDIHHALASFRRLWLIKEGRLFADLPADARALPSLEQLYDIKLRSVVCSDGFLMVSAVRNTNAEALLT